MNRIRNAVFPAALMGLLLSVLPGLPQSVSANLKLARQLDQAFVEIAEKVSPAVVVINSVRKPSAPPLDSGMDDNFDDVLPPDSLRRFHEQLRPETPEKTRTQGSGLIIRRNGFILTNRRVVRLSAERIEVRLRDGQVFPARLRGADPRLGPGRHSDRGRRPAHGHAGRFGRDPRGRVCDRHWGAI